MGNFFYNALRVTIGKYQGTYTVSGSNYTYNPTGNTFSLTPDPVVGHVYNAGLYGLQYVHHKQVGSNYNVKPTFVSTMVGPITESTISLTNRNSYCPSKLSTGGVIVKQASVVLFDEEKPVYDDFRYAYRNLLDGGKTQELIETIDYSWPQEVWTLRDELLSGSPFLSMDVIYTISENTEVLPHSIQLEIFMANPDCANDVAFLEHLATKNDPMPTWMIEILTGQVNVRTIRSELENQMAYHAGILSYAGNEVIKFFHEDTIFYPLDSLLLWNRKNNNLSAIIDIYGGQREYFSAIGLIDTLLTNDTLKSQERNELSTRKILYELLQSYVTQEVQYWNLNTVQQEELLTFAESGTLPAHREAKNILAFYYGYKFADDVSLNTPKSKVKKTTNAVQPDVSKTLKVYPNPTRGQVIFEYQYPSILVNLQLEIFSSTGINLDRIVLRGTSGVYIWDGEKQAAGSYFYKITSGGKMIDSGAIQISK